MSSYSVSNLALGQSKLEAMFAAGALKAIDPQVFKAFRRNAEIMIPSHKILRTREDRPLAAYFKLRTLRALGSGRSFNGTGPTGNSGVLNPAFNTVNDRFSLSEKVADDNVFSWPELYANEIENVFKNFSEGNESNATNFLFNNRSTVNAATSEGTFNVINNTFEIVESTAGNRPIQITEGMMRQNRWGKWPLDVFCDTVSFNKFAFLARQGMSNYQNTSFQFEGKTYILALDLDALAQALGYTKGYWITAPIGTYGVLDWIPRQNRETLDRPPYRYYTANNPIDAMDYAAFVWYIGSDTITNSVSQDLQYNFEFSVDLAYELAPLTNAAETPAQAVALV